MTMEIASKLEFPNLIHVRFHHRLLVLQNAVSLHCERFERHEPEEPLTIILVHYTVVTSECAH